MPRPHAVRKGEDGVEVVWTLRGFVVEEIEAVAVSKDRGLPVPDPPERYDPLAVDYTEGYGYVPMPDDLEPGTWYSDVFGELDESKAREVWERIGLDWTERARTGPNRSQTLYPPFSY